jgi:uncharacterized protein YggE
MLIEVSSTSMPIRPVIMEQRMAMVGKAVAADTPIEPGQQTYSATVTARWVFVGR